MILANSYFCSANYFLKFLFILKKLQLKAEYLYLSENKHIGIKFCKVFWHQLLYSVKYGIFIDVSYCYLERYCPSANASFNLFAFWNAKFL